MTAHFRGRLAWGRCARIIIPAALWLVLLPAGRTVVAGDEAGRQPQEDAVERRYLKRAAEIELLEAQKLIRFQAQQDAGRKAFLARLARKGFVAPDREAVVMAVFVDDVQVWIEGVPAAPLEREPDDDPDGPERAEPVPIRRFRVADESVCQLLYGGARSEDDARLVLWLQLQEKIREISQASSLTAAQSEKLKLAGCGDIYRFFEQVRGMQSKIAAIAEGAGDDLQETEQRVMELCRESRPLRDMLRAGGIHGPNSLLAKTARNMGSEAERSGQR